MSTPNEAADRLREYVDTLREPDVLLTEQYQKVGRLLDKALATERQRERERIADEVRRLRPMHVLDTDYVPQAKRRPDAVIDRASVLQIVNEVRGRLTDPERES